MDERWHDSLFQMSEATDENDLDFAITIFCVGTRKKTRKKKIKVIVSSHTVE